MNAKWLKQHAMLVAFVAAFVIVLGVVIWLQHEASGKKAEIDAALEEQMSQLNHLLQTKPAPTPANIDILKQDRAQVNQLYQELLAKVTQSRIHTPPDLRPVAFLQMMASQLAKLRQAADAARRQNRGRICLSDLIVTPVRRRPSQPAIFPKRTPSAS